MPLIWRGSWRWDNWGSKKALGSFRLFNSAPHQQISQNRQDISPHLQAIIAQRSREQARLYTIDRLGNPSHARVPGKNQSSTYATNNLAMAETSDGKHSGVQTDNDDRRRPC